MIYDLTISGDGLPTMVYNGLSIHQLRYVMSRSPARCSIALRPRDVSKPTRKAGGRWV